MSPLIAVARSSTIGPSPSGGASPTSSSELVSPLIDLASIQTLEPLLIPTSMSPEAVWTTTSPSRTLSICTSPEAVWTLIDASASSSSTSPEAERILPSPARRLIATSPEALSNETSPDAVLTSTLPNSPRPSVSAEAVETSTSTPTGAVMRTRTSSRFPRKNPERFSITTLSSWPSRLGRSSIRASSSSSGLAESSTTVSVPSVVSRSISPLGTRTSSESGPGVSNVSRLIELASGGAASRASGRRALLHVRKAVDRTLSPFRAPSFSALGEALEPFAGPSRRPGRAPRKGADEPAVHGNSFSCGRRLDRRLERLGEAERDAGGQPVVGRRLRRCFLLADVHERRVLSDEAHLDVPVGQLSVELERCLAECVEEPQARRTADRLQHAFGRGTGLLVTHRGDRGQVGLERFDEPCHLHDVIMTSLWSLSSVFLTRWRHQGSKT